MSFSRLCQEALVRHQQSCERCLPVFLLVGDIAMTSAIRRILARLFLNCGDNPHKICALFAKMNS
jgi:hypothetical protein